MSSEWSELCHFKYDTHFFEIRLFNETKANDGSSSESVQFYEKEKNSVGRTAKCPNVTESELLNLQKRVEKAKKIFRNDN